MSTNDLVEYINGRKIEYFDDSHTYFVDGKKVLSVTQIISEVLPSPYTAIDQMVLRNAANRGVELHKEIELYETQGLMGESIEFHHYISLKNKHKMQVIENEKLVIIEYQEKVLCAGRLDMIFDMNDSKKLGIGDIKRTSKIHLDHVKLQLNLYRIGYMQSYKKEIHQLKCFHLKGFVYELIDIPIDEQYATKSLELFLNQSL